MTKYISIIGCGWLGLPLAHSLIKDGYHIKGSTTSQDKVGSLKKKGIKSYHISISENGIQGDIQAFLKSSKIVVVNVPPGLRKNPDGNFINQMEMLVKAVEKSAVENVLYVSSTSVYEDDVSFPTITEDSPKNIKSDTSKQLIAVENLFMESTHFDTTIVRFGGLIGENRHPAHYLSGRKNIKDPESPVNLIHQEDCIAIITSILKNDLWNTDFNAAAPQHPSKNDYYTAVCREKNLPPPEFDHSATSKGKIISCKKLEHILSYKFRQNLQ